MKFEKNDDFNEIMEQSEIIVALAEYAHDTWSGWMEYMFGLGEELENGDILIKKKFADRWKRQVGTEFMDLPEDERESDYNEAYRMLEIMKECEEK